MVERENTISNLEINIRWIESIECHQFPGWGNVTMAMRDALELLKEQDDKDINVPIKNVRCKDCKHWTKALGGQCNVLTVNGCAHCTSPDWFCGDGEI